MSNVTIKLVKYIFSKIMAYYIILQYWLTKDHRHGCMIDIIRKKTRYIACKQNKITKQDKKLQKF